jgi:transcriptional regulator with XRE-family HTH domain
MTVNAQLRRRRSGTTPRRKPATQALSSAVPGSVGGSRSDDEEMLQWIGSEIRNLRKVRGLGLEQLAQLTGKSAAYLSLIERGLSRPSISVLKSVSTALGVQIAWFFPENGLPDPADRDVVVRINCRRRISFESGVTDFLLSPNLSGAIELLLSQFEPGSSNGESPYAHAGEEAGLVLEGRLELWVGEERYLLQAGDSFSFRSTQPHRYRNPGTTVTRVVWAVTPPSY